MRPIIVRARHGQRGQTLPMWLLAVVTALTLMFFSVNYADTIRWQVRAQNAADAAAAAALSVQATQWNKTMAILYSADIEEWRIRHLIEGMIDTANGNGGCNTTNTCLPIYQALQAQYWKAVNRYSIDIQMLQSLAPNGATSQAADALKIVQDLKATCGTARELADCAFTYHIIDYSYRPTTQQAGKDAYFAKLGGFTSPQDSTPLADWEPAKIEIATCATVTPLFNFSITGQQPQPYKVIGRAAATNVTQTSEWFTPGVDQDPVTNAAYQPTEIYDTTDDTFAVSASPRDWYQTNFPALNYTALPQYGGYNATLADDLEILLCWWSAIPAASYTTATDPNVLCAQS